MRFISSVALATFQGLHSPSWLMPTVMDNVGGEHYHLCRELSWTALPLLLRENQAEVVK